jgi:ABC-2 type transport system ATP-binding protein
MEMMIAIDNLDVRYRDVHAVRGLSLEVRRGEVFGLLGPNGAGKSSTLACIEGLRKPSSGSVRVAGHDVAREPAAVKQLLGVQLQHTALFNELTTTQLVRLFAALYNVFPSDEQIAGMLREIGLGQKARTRPIHLSGGQRQRLALLLATVNDPLVVLLDEPSTGLDPQARRGVWALVRRMRERGRTVLLTTHSMDEAQSLCDRVGIIEGGVMAALGTPRELIESFAPPLPPEEAARRQPNLEDVFLALTGRTLAQPESEMDEEARWLAQFA